MKRQIAALCAAITLSGLFMQPASATSIYDSTYRTTDRAAVGSMNINSANCVDADITSSYLDIIDTYDTNLASSYRNADSTGVSVQYSTNGIWSMRYTLVYWTEHAASLSWGQNVVNLVAPQSDVVYEVGIYTKAASGQGSSCEPTVGWSGATGTGGAVTISSDSFENVFVQGVDTNYPSGYEGNHVRSEPPAPPTTIYTGSVDCGNDTLEYLLITQDGHTHSVTLSYESVYRASWSYAFTSSSYSITVGCGNSLAASYGSVSPATSSNDWVCNTIDDPHYCVLS